ncbi:polysaccharide biosynthesis C-terminal domain-containing protein [Methylocapsa acidiphila]|uniref:oligosaccharide flippase family protein n=1 Tax=Methylocapsa acidiphila TaxID=133552 RepID=UPI000404CB9F|nr:lipopolysaccharide biosynthesis protein [Methylocapsa acidiphila]
MLIRDTALYAVAKLLPGIFGLATTAVLTRFLNPLEYGHYGLALVVMMLGSTVLFDWLGMSFLRFYQARREDPDVLVTFVTLFVAIAILSAAALALALIFGLIPANRIGVSIVGMIMVWTYSWFELVSRLAVAEFQPFRYLTMNLGRSSLILVGTTAAAWLTANPLWAAMGNAAGMFGGAFLGRIPIPLPSLRRFDRKLARDVIFFGAPVAASMTLYSLIDNGTRVLLDKLDSAAALGIYTAASILMQTTLGVMAAGVYSAGYSLAVQAVESGDQAAARRQLLANSTLLLAILAPASLGMALAGRSIATTLVGAKFIAGVIPLMPWMAASSFFGCFRAFHLDHAFQLGKKPHLQIWIMGLAVIIAIGLSYVLIPRVGPVGAAIGVTVAMAVSCVHAVIAGRRAYPLPFPIEPAARIGLCCAVMAMVVAQLPDSGWAGLISRGLVGSVTYAAAAVALNVLDSRERAFSYARRAAQWLAQRRQGAAAE